MGDIKAGRPITGSSKKVGIDIYTPFDRLQIIDGIVKAKKAGGDKKASRSELYNEAMDDYLKKHGHIDNENI